MMNYAIMHNALLPNDLEKGGNLTTDLHLSSFYRHTYGALLHVRVLADRASELEKKNSHLKKNYDACKRDYSAANTDRNRLQEKVMYADQKVAASHNREIELNKLKTAAEAKVKELDLALTSERKLLAAAAAQAKEAEDIVRAERERYAASVTKANESEELVGQLKKEVEALKKANGEMSEAMVMYKQVCDNCNLYLQSVNQLCNAHSSACPSFDTIFNGFVDANPDANGELARAYVDLHFPEEDEEEEAEEETGEETTAKVDKGVSSTTTVRPEEEATIKVVGETQSTTVVKLVEEPKLEVEEVESTAVVQEVSEKVESAAVGPTV